MTTKSKTNALDALRALIAERQQYDQWIGTLQAKRDSTPQNVFDRVNSDYQTRLGKVVDEIRGHAEELQLSIATLSSRLTEVAKEEDAKRDSIQEAELRAAVGEYDVSQWESMRSAAGRELEKIAADRGSLETQLAELESIRKLSEVTASALEGGASSPSTPSVSQAPPELESKPAADAESRPADQTAPLPGERRPFTDAGWPTRESPGQPQAAIPASQQPQASPVSPANQSVPDKPAEQSGTPRSTPPRGTLAHDSRTAGQLAAQAIRANADPSAAGPRPSASPAAPPPSPTPPPRKRITPTGRDAQISSGFSRPVPTPPDGRPEVNKTLKCPECGTANYPTEWYCERCGGELATV